MIASSKSYNVVKFSHMGPGPSFIVAQPFPIIVISITFVKNLTRHCVYLIFLEQPWLSWSLILLFYCVVWTTHLQMTSQLLHGIQAHVTWLLQEVETVKSEYGTMQLGSGCRLKIYKDEYSDQGMKMSR